MNEITVLPGEIVPVDPEYLQHLMDIVLDTVSARSQRDYGRALNDFLTWYARTGQTELSRATVNAHVAWLRERGTPASSINQRLAALRKFANEAADNLLIPESAAQAISRIKNIRIEGKKLGNWLSRAQAQAMLRAPDSETIKGKRDRAILAVMLGCGLRREEIVSLTVDHLQQRDGRWVILNLHGKHNRTRTIPMAGWIKALIDEYTTAAGVTKGVLFRRIRRGDTVQPDGMQAQAVWDIVQAYAPIKPLAPHDLRRTFAKLAASGGAPLVQIQKTLGHASIQTTENYIGADQDLIKGPSDYIGPLG